MGGGEYLTQEIPQQTTFDGYGIVPYDTTPDYLVRIQDSLSFMIEHPWVGLVAFIGTISCSVVAIRVFKKNPWVNEMFRMWRTR